MSQQDLLYSRVIEYVKSQEWRYQVDEEGSRISLGMNLKCKLNSCRVIVGVSDKEIQAFAVCPINASPENYSDVVEFITRANYGLKIGKFEFDHNDGEVRYQTCLPCQEGVPSLRDIERVIDLSFIMMQRYGDGLTKNLMGFGSPAEDIKAIEG